MLREVLAQPFLLTRSRLATSYFLALAVENHNVPGSEFVAVVAIFRIARSRAKVLKVEGCPSGVKFVIADGRPSARLYAAPGPFVAFEIFFCTIRIGSIANNHDRSRDFL